MGKTKFGRGLGREVVAAVNGGELAEPLTAKSVEAFARKRGWEPTDGYVNSLLANGSSPEFRTNKKYFEALGGGKYRVKLEFKGRARR